MEKIAQKGWVSSRSGQRRDWSGHAHLPSWSRSTFIVGVSGDWAMSMSAMGERNGEINGDCDLANQRFKLIATLYL
jgi:hypothetical protein